MLSTDRRLFEEGSAVRARVREYGRLFDKLFIIVPTLRGGSFRETKIAGNVTLYPTRSRGKFSMAVALFRIGSEVLSRDSKNFCITAQDPFGLGFLAYLLAKRFRVPLQLQVHTDFLSPYFARSLRSRIERFLAFFLLPRASSVRVVSKRIRDGLVFGRIVAEERITVLPVFVDIQKSVDTPAFERLWPSFSPAVLMVSRLEPEKDVACGLEAFRELLDSHPQAGLLIAGSGSERARLEKRVSEFTIEENVVFLGWQQPQKLRELLRRVDIFFNTSRFEGYGMSLVEAAAAGCPVVTSDVGLVGDVLTEEEILVCPAGEKECFASKLAELADNASLRGNLGRKGREAVLERVISSKQAYLELFKDSFRLCR